MLTHLQIKNYLLIEHLELPVSKGLTIITGETGAGKSILLGAIGLLLGQRAENKVLYNSEQKCIVEGTFDITGYGLQGIFEENDLDYSATTHIRREIAPNGKSRAFVNDTPVNLETLRKITERLVDIHSQHDSILLGNGVVQIDLLDAFGNTSALLSEYQQAYFSWKEAQESLQRLQEEAAAIRKENDYNHYLWQELDAANLQSGELEELEQELAVLENASEIKGKFHEMCQYFDNQEVSILSLLNEVSYLLTQANRLAPVYQSLVDRLATAQVELKDLYGDIEDVAERVEVNEERIDQVNQRLNILYQLIKKHQATKVDELIVIRDELRARIDKFESLDDTLNNAREKAEAAEQKMLEQGKKLSDARQASIPPFEKIVTDTARDLGISHAVFRIGHTGNSVPLPSGIDKIDFLFSANKGLAPQPLKNVASGGEFSRLMLAFKYAVAERKQLATLIFDEIDTGISGEVARKMGEMLRQMAGKHQLLAITHLHQIAAFGNSHLYVYKDNTSDTTVSKIKPLNQEERVQELAQMIGGVNPSEAVLQNARELLLRSL